MEDIFMNELNENTVVEETVETTDPAASAPEEESAEAEAPVTYSQAEVEAMVSKAVNAAVKKAKEKSVKSNDELTMELNELKAQLALKENQSYVATEVTKRGIPTQLTDLFYAEDEDSSKSKLNLFSKWYKDAVDKAVEDKLNATQPPHFSVSESSSKAPKSLDFLDFYNSKNND